MTRLLPMIAAALVGVGAYFFFVHEPAQETAVASSTASTLSAPVAEVQAADNADEEITEAASIQDMMLGNPDAPVTVIEYASYTCPHCARFHSGTYKELKKDYIDTGKINFVYREVYFDRYGLWASMIARCAGPEKFFGMTDLIYSGQAEWSRAGEPAAIIEELRKIGRLAGLGNEQLEACLSDEGKAKSLVEWYQANVAADSIDSTPSFVINGKKYANMNYADMSEILDDAAK